MELFRGRIISAQRARTNEDPKYRSTSKLFNEVCSIRNKVKNPNSANKGVFN
jgi:hypothetical protein